MKAMAHEFGVPERNIPARPFFYQTLEEELEKLEDLIDIIVTEALKA